MNAWTSLVFSHPDTFQAGMAILLKTALIYVFLIGGLRLLGKRELGQMTVYDMVLMVVLANAVQNAMVGDDNSLVGGLISATTLLVMNRLLYLWMRRSKPVQEALLGEPMVLLQDGELRMKAMIKEGITQEQVEAALREHGLERLHDAKLAVLEVDGSISVVPSTSPMHRSRRHFRAVRMH